MEPLNRRDLDEALARQNVAIEALFNARMETLRFLIAELSADLAAHKGEDQKKFDGLDSNVISLRLSRAKLAGIATVSSLIASGFTALMVQLIILVLKN